ncbi:unnamed protein product [Effrenium voratum]|nr:unnamed protein product [Effrenium voratum]
MEMEAGRDAPSEMVVGDDQTVLDLTAHMDKDKNEWHHLYLLKYAVIEPIDEIRRYDFLDEDKINLWCVQLPMFPKARQQKVYTMQITIPDMRWEFQPGHKPFQSYQHPDAQKPSMNLQPEAYASLDVRRVSGGLPGVKSEGWTIPIRPIRQGAQCAMFEGQEKGPDGPKMLEKATPEEINAQELTEDTLEGFTPLHWAVLSDNPKARAARPAVIWLLKHGADKDIKDIQGRSAEDLVEDYWGDFHQRYWGHAPKQDGLPQVDKAVATKRFLGVFEQVVRKGNARSS